MSTTLDPYAILGVEPTAKADEIRTAYRALAKRCHPDAVAGREELMIALNNAWAVLKDAGRRAAYDRERSAARQPASSRAADEPAWQATPPPPTPSASAASGTLLAFGRYAGWPVEAVASLDSDYLEWLARTVTGRRYRPAIEAALAERRRVVATAAPTPPRSRRRFWR